jgi:hypothetical protein
MRADIIASASHPKPRIICSDAWFQAKQCQLLEDGTRATITSDRAARLADYSDAWPPHLQAPRGHRDSDLAAAIARAVPTIKAAAKRARSGRND